MEQFDPSTILTQAVISSIAISMSTFVSHLINGLFIQPMVKSFMQQLALGGASEMQNNGNAFSIPPLFPFPPITFQITPDGYIQFGMKPPFGGASE